MAKYKPCDYAQTQLVAVSLAEQLVPGTLEHTIHFVVQAPHLTSLRRLVLQAYRAAHSAQKNRSDGRNINLEMIQAGFAWWYRHFAPNALPFEKAEAEAREAKCGLWADPEPVPPWAWRKSKSRDVGRLLAQW